MRAVDIKNGKGHADALFIGDVPYPQPHPSDAIVKIKAFGINRMDLLQREGNYPVPPQAPKTLGVEFSGVVEQAAEAGEREFHVGDEVFGLAYGGAYAEYIAISTHMLIHKPAHMSWEIAAGIPETWITALQAMYLIGEFAAGKTILWHAGASSVSIAGIQLSRAAGAGAVFATAGSDAKLAYCQSTLGATAAFNYHSQDWAAGVLAATDGRGVDIIVDPVGQSHFAGNLRAAAPDARIVALAFLSGAVLPPGTNLQPLLLKRLRLEGTTLRSRDEQYQRRLRDLLVEQALPGLADGTLMAPIERVFPWDRVAEAHTLMESNETKGKIVCVVE